MTTRMMPGMMSGMMYGMAPGTSSEMMFGTPSGMTLSTNSEMMTSAMTFGTTTGMMHGFFPPAPKPKLYVEIKMDGATLEGPLQRLPIIHNDASILKKQEQHFQHYSVYIDMKNGIQYKCESLTRIIVVDGQRHPKSTVTIYLENSIHSATNFDFYDFQKPYLKNTPKYTAASGLIYVAIKKTKHVFRAMLQQNS